MKKATINILFLGTIFLSTVAIHNAIAGINRGPSVDPLVEVDIENTKNPNQVPAGFNFEKKPQKFDSVRKPAGITNKDGHTSPYSYLGPVIFLLALPFAIWIVIAKKVSDKPLEEKIDYYPKTFQFNPFKTEYQKNDVDDDDDINYPKAS